MAAATACILLLTSALTACNRTDPADAAETGDTVTAACDRACVLDIGNAYVAALVAHDPTKAALADNLAFVENIERKKPGEGLWQSLTAGPTDFAVAVPDAQNQSFGWLGMLQKDGEPALVAIRLKIGPDGRVSEAEHLVTDVRPENLERLETPRPGLLADVSADKRLPHDELIRLGLSYYDALDDNDGTLMPFAADCERHENGMITAGANAGPGPNGAGAHPIARDCAGQLTSNVMAYITSIDNRRVFAADPQTGLVMGLSHFRHPMDFDPYQVTALDGTKIRYARGEQLNFEPFDLPAAHIFKVGDDGKVHEIEAMGFMTKYNAPTGWE